MTLPASVLMPCPTERMGDAPPVTMSERLLRMDVLSAVSARVVISTVSRMPKTSITTTGSCSGLSRRLTAAAERGGRPRTDVLTARSCAAIFPMTNAKSVLRRQSHASTTYGFIGDASSAKRPAKQTPSKGSFKITIPQFKAGGPAKTQNAIPAVSITSLENRTNALSVG